MTTATDTDNLKQAEAALNNAVAALRKLGVTDNYILDELVIKWLGDVTEVHRSIQRVSNGLTLNG